MDKYEAYGLLEQWVSLPYLRFRDRVREQFIQMAAVIKGST